MALVLCIAACPALPIVSRIHVFSLAAGRIEPTVTRGTPRLLNELDYRFLDLAAGPRIGPAWALMATCTAVEYQSDYAHSNEPIYLATVIGLSVVHARSLRSAPHSLVLSGNFRGTAGWGVFPVVKFTELSAEASTTYWGASPSVELSWRHEFFPFEGGEPPAPWSEVSRDRFRLAVRVALGGTYEFGR